MSDYPEDEPSKSAKDIADAIMARMGLRVANWNNDMNRTVDFRGHLIEFTPGGLDRLRKKLGGGEK
jgi:hypothetical protein